MHETREMEESAGLKTPAAARFLNVSPKWLHAQRVRGTGPKYYRIGPKLVRYRLRDLVEFQEQGLVEPAGPPPAKPAVPEAARRRSA
jgi:hypothetical protein